jgi:L-ascorbate metabolism protein UlaG (beta-lactamase superfamily)
MQNKAIFLVISLVLIISLIGIYLALKEPKEFKERLESLEGISKRLDREIRLLNQRIAPYIYTGEAVGFVIEFENGVKFYFAGATGLSADLKLIGDYYKPDVAFLPIGNIYTTCPKTAAMAANLINPSSYIIPNFYASFPELVKTPEQFFEELKKYNLKAQALEFQVGKEKEILGIKVEWLGHSHWLFEGPKGTRILVNPEVRYNPNFPKKYQELVQLKRIDFVLITHGHFDSMTLSDIRKWGELFDPIFITPYELGIWLKANLPAHKIIALGQGSRISQSELLKLGIPKEKIKNLSDIVINVVPAAHSSSATPEGLPVRY